MALPPIESMPFHPVTEALVQTLCQKTQNDNPQFFRVLVNYYFCKVASMMRCNVATHDRGSIPVNMYAINLASSGFGKGYSTNIMEEQVINEFRERFLEVTFPEVAELNIAKIANKRAARKLADPDDELVRVSKEFESLGHLLFSFDSATPAAVKQMRHKLLMADAGSMNLEIDEIGSNFIGQIDALNVFLELYDVGKTKAKLIKSSLENARNEEIIGKTPTNMMLFGTPSKLLNGAKTEEEFMSAIEAGFGRRCLFGFSRLFMREVQLTPEQVYLMTTDTTSSASIAQLSSKLGQLADRVNFGLEKQMSKDVSLELIEYKLNCEKLAGKLPEHDEIRKAELSHRYFKTLKIAGMYAFIDETFEITAQQLHHAIRLVEESGKGFNALLARERNYVKLAQYIACTVDEVTEADLVEDCPFFRGSIQAKLELLTLATAWGYKNNIVIKTSFDNGIKFYSGDSLKETNLDEMIISYSDDVATDYQNELVPFDGLHKLTQEPGYNWINHHLVNSRRVEANCVNGFNMIVIDVDEDVSLDTARLLMSKYTYMIYTTKRHQAFEDNIQYGDRFRLVLPMNFELQLDADDFKEFMKNVYEWLPFDSDEQTGQRARKWLTCNGIYEYNDGELVDCLPFIPKTSKNEERKQSVVDLQNLSNLERWFVQNTGKGNRSHQLVKYALLLVDSNGTFDQVREAVLALNDKLQDKLPEAEVHTTILVTAAQRISQRIVIV
jgi:hypothetical protein